MLPLDDLTATSGYSGGPMKVIVRIETEGTPDTFTWSFDNGDTWASDIPIPTIVDPANPPNLITTEATLLPAVHNIQVKFAADTGHHAGDTWTFWVGVPRIARYGMATLYFEYLHDRKDYLRSRNVYHCPSITRTENVDIRGNIRVKHAEYPSDSDLWTFDPLWAGFNTYDVTYNFDQYDADIRNFDEALGSEYQTQQLNERRQLSNPRAPADTVVCWCYGHRRDPSPNYPLADSLDPDLAKPATDRALRDALRGRLNERDVILWLDGTVDSMRPYLMEGSNGYYWVPPFLYTPEGGAQ